MTIGNPWAWLGLVGVALPIVIHLLGKERARLQKFPSLRFIAMSRLDPTRRRRVSDLLLLVVRVAIVTAAVFALAQPWFQRDSRTSSNARDSGSLLARAIIVDTSASMKRATIGGGRAVDSARARATTIAAAATSSIVIETVAPATAIAGAVEWLKGQRGRRELAIVSDFQIGAIDSTDVARVPPDIGVQLAQIGPLPEPLPIRARMGDHDVTITPRPDRTDVSWSAAAPTVPLAGPTLFAGRTELPRAEAARSAASTLGTLAPMTPDRPIEVIFPGYERHADLLREAAPITQRWMGDAVMHLHADQTLASAAAAADPVDASSIYEGRFTVVARTQSGRPAVLASERDTDGKRALQLWVLADAGSMTSAALIAAVRLAAVPSTPAGELERSSVAPESLALWQRPAGTSPARSADPAGASDGRWFWLVALTLIVIESFLRRRRGSSVEWSGQGSESATQLAGGR